MGSDRDFGIDEERLYGKKHELEHMLAEHTPKYTHKTNHPVFAVHNKNLQTKYGVMALGEKTSLQQVLALTSVTRAQSMVLDSGASSSFVFLKRFLGFDQ